MKIQPSTAATAYLLAWRSLPTCLAFTKTLHLPAALTSRLTHSFSSSPPPFHLNNNNNHKGCHTTTSSRFLLSYSALRMASTDADSSSTIDIAGNVELVREKMAQAVRELDSTTTTTTPAVVAENVRLVAVSKTKPLALLQQAYDTANIRVFGENYVQELVEKVPQMPYDDVTWHFIGNLQSNKVNLLLSAFLLPNKNQLHQLVLETVNSLKLARKLNTAIENHYQSSSTENDNNDNKKLRIFVQVNTSGEESKSGVPPDQVVSLCRDIIETCPRLHLLGLMTIGAPGDDSCLDALVHCRQQVMDAAILASDSVELELSMGMSMDYYQAILKGSTNVRVGSTIFGARDYSNVSSS